MDLCTDHNSVQLGTVEVVEVVMTAATAAAAAAANRRSVAKAD